MSSEKGRASGKKKSKIDIEWENRVLCSDGNCIGVIGPDKRCKECGRLFEGKLPSGFSELETASEPDDAGADNAEEVKEETSAAVPVTGREKPGFDDTWENRVLCSDGNCIGVIGSDGNCKECGKSYDPKAAE